MVGRKRGETRERARRREEEEGGKRQSKRRLNKMKRNEETKREMWSWQTKNTKNDQEKPRGMFMGMDQRETEGGKGRDQGRPTW
jgi:hypothetical protein